MKIIKNKAFKDTQATAIDTDVVVDNTFYGEDKFDTGSILDKSEDYVFPHRNQQGLTIPAGYYPNGIDIPVDQQIKFTLDNTGLTSQSIGFTELTGIDIKITCENTGEVLKTGAGSYSGTLNSTGMDNVAIVITGDVIICKYNLPKIIGLEISCMTNLNIIRTYSDTSQEWNQTMKQEKTIKFFSLFGQHKILSMNQMFNGCRSLEKVLNFDFCDVIDITGLFTYCKSLVVAPKIIAPKAIKTGAIFSECPLITEVYIYAPLGESISSICENCTNLIRADLYLGTLKGNNGRWFYACANLEEIDFHDTSFAGCTTSLYAFTNTKKIKKINVKKWDFINLRKCMYLFDNLQILTGDEEIIITDKLEDATGMFRNCSGLKKIPVDLSKIHITYCMFGGCTSLTTIDDPIILSDIEDASSMFSGCSNLSNIHSIVFGESIKDTNHMFYGCRNLKNFPEMNLENVELAKSMFSGCTSLTTIPTLNMPKLINAESMFQNCNTLTSISSIHIEKIEILISMFVNCTKLTTVPDIICGEYVRKVENMFSRTSISIDDRIEFIDKLNKNANTPIIDRWVGLFSGFTGTTLSLQGLDTDGITSTKSMFSGCTALTTIIGLSLPTGLVDMSNMFNGSEKLESVPTFPDTSMVTNMYKMFYWCKALKSIPFINTQNVSNAEDIFTGCSYDLVLPELDFSKVKDSTAGGSTEYIGHISIEQKSFRIKNVKCKMRLVNADAESVEFLLNNVQDAAGSANLRIIKFAYYSPTPDVSYTPGWQALTTTSPCLLNALSKGWTISPKVIRTE